jgi:hypothetical protein
MEPTEMTPAEQVDTAIRYVKNTMRQLRTILHVLKGLEAQIGEATDEH